jgi:hypothetical protein
MIKISGGVIVHIFKKKKILKINIGPYGAKTSKAINQNFAW